MSSPPSRTVLSCAKVISNGRTRFGWEGLPNEERLASLGEPTCEGRMNGVTRENGIVVISATDATNDCTIVAAPSTVEQCTQK